MKNINEFEKLIKKNSEKFDIYYQNLISYNEKVNLTAITEKEDVYIKHFLDSVLGNNFIPKNATVVDVGTGAGFPGIPLKIVNKDIKITLLDSLNKRINFLDEVIEKLNLKNIETKHGRAEEFGKDKNYRENYDIATSRAVANLSTLSEYLIPLVKIGGRVISMKGQEVKEEISNAKNAIKNLRCFQFNFCIPKEIVWNVLKI